MQELEKKYTLALSKRIKDLRIEKGISQEMLAEKIDRSREFVNRIEKCKNQISFTTLVRLALAFNISLKELVDLKINVS